MLSAAFNFKRAMNALLDFISLVSAKFGLLRALTARLGSKESKKGQRAISPGHRPGGVTQ